MRILVIGMLSSALIGCSCLMPPQASLEGYRMAVADPPAELEPAPFTASPAAEKPKSTATHKPTKPARTTSVAAKTAKPSSARPGNDGTSIEEKETSPTIMKPETPPSAQSAKKKSPAKPDVPASGQPGESSDTILKKARATIAAKLEDPASAEFDDMKREMRKNTFGQPVDTICGHVRGKKTSGETAEERAFLYLVKDDEAYVVDGNAESAAATAYRNICMNSGFARKNLAPTREP